MVVVVDVLRFTTCVDVAVARGAVVLPYPWAGPGDEGAAAFAAAQRAELAGRREDPATRWSWSPPDLAASPPATRLVLPSPNGSALAFAAAAEAGAATVLAGCLRNATAVAGAARRSGGTVTVIAAGERWPGGGKLRPAVEDLLGAGAVLAALGASAPSPEARAAMAAFEAARPELPGWLAGSASGRELAERGWDDDVAVAAALDVSGTAPVLRDGAFVAAR